MSFSFGNDSLVIREAPPQFSSQFVSGGDFSSSSSGASSVSFGLSAAAGASAAASAGAAAAGAAESFTSAIELAVLRATVPVETTESEEINVLGQRGLWLNRAEVANWRGELAISQYAINEDSNPEVINKRVAQSLEYVQELAIRYLRPPTPPPPGEIVIVQQGNTLTAPAPPLVIRQQPARPDTPEPLVVREAPPQPPASVGRKVITISGRRLPPPPRKVVIERLAPLPAKPQSVLVERWLPYAQVKRRVIFQRSGGADPVAVRPRNVVVQWEAPSVSIRKEIKYLGVVRANPAEYVSRYGASLRGARDLPQFVLDIKTPDGLVLAADHQASSVYELEGDLQGLRLVDLDREGLSEYRAQLERLGFGGASVSSVSVSGSASGLSADSALINEIFSRLDVDGSGSLSQDEARRALLVLNSKLGRSYGENDLVAFFGALDRDGNAKLNLREFRAAYERLLSR